MKKFRVVLVPLIVWIAFLIPKVLGIEMKEFLDSWWGFPYFITVLFILATAMIYITKEFF